MDDTIMAVFQVLPAIALAAFGVRYAFGRGVSVPPRKLAARTTPPTRDRPGLLQESFTGFCERTWFMVPLIYAPLILLRWLAGKPDIVASLIQRTPAAATLYGYIGAAYLARDIWRVRKPLGALLTGRGDWTGVKTAHTDAYAVPRPSLGVWSHGLMVRSFSCNGRKPYGTGSSRERHDHARRRSSNTAIASFARDAEP